MVSKLIMRSYVVLLCCIATRGNEVPHLLRDMWNNEGKLSGTLSTTWKFLDKLNNEAMLCIEMSSETYDTTKEMTSEDGTGEVKFSGAPRF